MAVIKKKQCFIQWPASVLYSVTAFVHFCQCRVDYGNMTGRKVSSCLSSVCFSVLMLIDCISPDYFWPDLKLSQPKETCVSFLSHCGGGDLLCFEVTSSSNLCLAQDKQESNGQRSLIEWRSIHIRPRPDSMHSRPKNNSKYLNEVARWVRFTVSGQFTVALSTICIANTSWGNFPWGKQGC